MNLGVKPAEHWLTLRGKQLLLNECLKVLAYYNYSHISFIEELIID